MADGPIRRFLDKRTDPVCQEAAKAIDPYFDLLGHECTAMGMMPLQTLFVFMNGKLPKPETVEHAIKMGSAQSGIPEPVLRLHAECLFGQRVDASRSQGDTARSTGGVK